MRSLLLFLGLIACLTLSAGKLTIFVSIAPMLEAVQAIGGPDVTVSQLVPPGSSPETFQPAPKTIASLGKSQTFFTIGVPFEQTLVPKLQASFPKLPIVDGSQGMKFRTFDDGGKDPHVWLSISNMMRFADTVAQTLSKLDPENAASYQKRLLEYKALLKKLDDRTREMLAPLSGKSVLVYHPAFGYFLNEYGIEQKAIEEEGKEPSGSELKKTLQEARKMAPPAIFVQPQFSPRTAQTVAEELSCKVVKLDPLPAKLSTGLEAIAAAIAEAYCTTK